MSFNYRVAKEWFDGEDWFTLREVYYEEDGVTVRAWSSRAVPAGGETADDLRSDLQMMLSAFDLPVVEIGDTDDDVRWARKRKENR